MRKSTLAIATMIMFGLASASFADWEISFGKEKGQVGLRAPLSDEDFPHGPNSYRLINDELWILDSAGGAIRCFDASNQVKGEIGISLPLAAQGFAKDALLDDFAVQLTNGEVVAIIAVDGLNRQIIKFDKFGKELLKIQVKPDQLIQLDQVEIDSTGQFYVGDFAKRHIAVFSAEGKMLRTIPWQFSGFAVDKENNLYMLQFAESKGHACIKLSAEGKELTRVELGMPEAQNPRIWSVNDKGEMLISVVPPEGDPNNHNLLTYSATGEILNKVAFKNPYYINRYLMGGKDSAWLVNADYGDASSKIKISPLK